MTQKEKEKEEKEKLTSWLPPIKRLFCKVISLTWLKYGYMVDK